MAHRIFSALPAKKITPPEFALDARKRKVGNVLSAPVKTKFSIRHNYENSSWRPRHDGRSAEVKHRLDNASSVTWEKMQ
jgi:hypothetical protein